MNTPTVMSLGDSDLTIKDEVAAWAGASDKLRDVVKWTATSFGALGALLVGTAPLSGVAKLQPTLQSYLLAAAFASLALAGVAYVIWKSTSLLAPSMVALTDVRSNSRYAGVRTLVASEPEAFLGTWGRDVETFLDNRAQEYRLLAEVDKMIVREANEADVRKLRELRAKLIARVESLGRVSQRLLAVAQFSELSTSFNDARPKLFGGAAAVIVGTAGYLTVLATGTQDSGNSEPSTLPALVALTAAGKDTVGQLVGARCPSPFRALVLEGGSDGPWVVLVTDPRCTSGKLSIATDDASVLLGYPSR
jgi:hypothetical protein